jgi:hypothetical protein
MYILSTFVEFIESIYSEANISKSGHAAHLAAVRAVCPRKFEFYRCRDRKLHTGSRYSISLWTELVQYRYLSVSAGLGEVLALECAEAAPVVLCVNYISRSRAVRGRRVARSLPKAYSCI